MNEQQIHLIGYDEIVFLGGLLGLKGTIVEDSEMPEKFLKEFEKLIKNETIGMIIIAIELSDELFDFLLEFKLKNRVPFVYYLPDIFNPNIENENKFLKKIEKILNQIIL